MDCRYNGCSTTPPLQGALLSLLGTNYGSPRCPIECSSYFSGLLIPCCHIWGSHVVGAATVLCLRIKNVAGSLQDLAEGGLDVFILG